MIAFMWAFLHVKCGQSTAAIRGWAFVIGLEGLENTAQSGNV